jgi:hypothetical protein
MAVSDQLLVLSWKREKKKKKKEKKESKSKKLHHLTNVAVLPHGHGVTHNLTTVLRRSPPHQTIERLEDNGGEAIDDFRPQVRPQILGHGVPDHVGVVLDTAVRGVEATDDFLDRQQVLVGRVAGDFLVVCRGLDFGEDHEPGEDVFGFAAGFFAAGDGADDAADCIAHS